MSENKNKENEPNADHKNADVSVSSLKVKLNDLEYNLDCLIRVGVERNELLQKTTSELSRLKETVSNLLLKVAGNENNNIYNERQVYVGNFDRNATTQDLEMYFKKFGNVVAAWFLRKSPTSQCGIVEFASKNMANAALLARTHIYEGRRFICRRAINRCHLTRTEASAVALSPKSKTTKRDSRYKPY